MVVFYGTHYDQKGNRSSLRARPPLDAEVYTSPDKDRRPKRVSRDVETWSSWQVVDACFIATERWRKLRKNRGTPSYHPLIAGIFHNKPSSYGDTSFMATPIWGHHVNGLVYPLVSNMAGNGESPNSMEVSIGKSLGSGPFSLAMFDDTRG